MARNHGRIFSSIWTDDDFRQLTPDPQRFYMFLISQPNLNHAGLIPMTLRRWAGSASGLTVPDVQHSLKQLEVARFVVVDEDVEEVLVRSLVRNDGIWKQPKVMLAMESAAREITSPVLQAALVAELDRIDVTLLSDEPPKSGESARVVVSGVIERLREAFAKATAGVSGRVSGTLSEPSADASSDPFPDPPSGAPGPEGSVTTDPTADRTPNKGEAPGQDGFCPSCGKGIGKGIGNPHACAHARSPAPTPTPAPIPPSAGAVAPRPAADAPVTAQTLIGEWIDRCPKRPPGTVIGQVSKHVKAMLDEGIAPDDIRRGFALWMSKGLNPSTLPSVVNEVMNSALATSGPAQPSRNKKIISAAMERAMAAEAAQAAGRAPAERTIVRGEIAS
ncbi:hypothetical protein ABT061_15705 [Streptosporangium sp. NPDC002544]|uniref:hypothetical protein n=1 Tax=Streptosporangium sp. NPDC002544 TaxID=3154538 RepID=UPI003328EAB5